MTVRNSTRTKVAVLDGAAGRPIRYTHFDTISESLNNRFSRSGMRHVGHVFDPPFEVSGATYTSANAATSRDLNTIFDCVVLPRRSNTVRTTIKIFGSNIIVRALPFRFTRPSTVATLGFATTTVANGPNIWAETTFSTTWANVHEGANIANELAIWGVYYEARQNVTAGFPPTGKMFSISVFQEFLSAANIPIAAP